MSGVEPPAVARDAAPRAVATPRRLPARAALLDQLQRDGVRHLFGNPGSTEEGFLDALTDAPDLRYVMGLQESVVVATADGYARMTGRPAVVQLHAAVGLGNAMAMLYQAHRSGTPMVVFAGEGRARDASLDGFLCGDLVRIAEPVVKWAHRVTHAEHLQRVLRRAMKVAATPPRGPVFLALPLDVLDAEVEAERLRTPVVHLAGGAPASLIATAADRLARAERPIIICGDGVAGPAMATLSRLAEAIGAPVHGAELSELTEALRVPLFVDLLSHGFGEANRAITAEADVVLAAGTPLFPELFASRAPHFRPDAFLVQLDADPWQLSKNDAADVGLWGDPAVALGQLAEAVERRLDDGARAAATRRGAAWKARATAAREAQARAWEAQSADGAMTPSQLARAVVAALPAGAVIYDELITTGDELRHYARAAPYGAYLLARGGCIGVGWPGAIGAKLATDRPVVALSGDGSASYVHQCLWTAVHERLDLVFVVANNRSYRILKVNLLAYWQERGERPRPFPHMDLLDPAIDFALLARAYGATGHTVSDASALQAAMARGFAEGGVHVIDARVSGSIEDELRARFGAVAEPH